MFRHMFGVLMNEAGDGGTGGGGGESTALAVSTGTDLAPAGGDGDGSGDDGAGAGDGNALATTDANSEPIFDRSGKLTQGTSKVFRQLETANPQARAILGKAQRALGTQGKLTSMLGVKPFDRIKELNNFWKKVGGPQGLEALRATVQDMEQSDALYEKADPQLIAKMTETPAAKQAFVKLFPHSVAKLRELAPMTYTRFIGMQQLHSLEKSEVSVKGKDGQVIATEPIDIPFRLRRIVGMIPWAVDQQTGKFAGGQITSEQVASLQNDLTFIFSYLDQIRSYANATPEDLTPPKEDTSAAQVQKAQQEKDAAIQESWKVQRNSVCNEMLSDEVRKQTKGMELSGTIIADITARARKSINEIRKAQPDNNQKIQGFFEGKNLNGYLAYNKRIVGDHAQSAVEKAVALYARKSTRRAAPAAAAAATTTTPAASTTNAQGAPQAQGQVVKLSAQQAEQLGGRHGVRWMKQPLAPGLPGTTKEMRQAGRQMLRKGNPLNLPEGTIVQFPG